MRARLVSGADPGRYVGALVVVAGVYYLVGRIGLELAYLDGAVAALWPPAGFGLAVLFLYGIRLWPAVVVGDLLLGDFSTPLGTVLAQTVGNTVAVVAAALLLRRLTGGRGDLERVADVLALVACAFVAALISAAFGPLSLRLGGVIPADELGRVFRTWTLSDACGVLVVAPVILTWASRGLRGIHRREVVEGAIALALLVALAELPPQRDVPYIVFPGAAVVGAALRAARRVGGDPRRVLDHGLEHGAQRRAVRARVDHRQPARDAALHRDRGADLAACSPPSRPSARRWRRRWRRASAPSVRSPTSRPRCAGWPPWSRVGRRRAACSSG